MNSRSNPRFSTFFAFTLIELLTVIAIIAVLMGLLFPAIGTVKETARKAQAKNDVAQIVTAVRAYYTEYGKYPPIGSDATQTRGSDVVVGDEKANVVDNNNAVFDTLRAIKGDSTNPENRYNPRKVVFFEGKSVTNPAQPRAGFLDRINSGGGGGGAVDASKQGCFFDPWGSQYNVVIDTDYDGQIKVDDKYSDFSHPTDSPRTGVGAFALGKDQKLGEPKAGLNNRYRDGQKTSDDVISWQ